MQLHQVAQRAADLDRAEAFYTRLLGANPVARFDPPGLLFYRIGSARLLLDKAAPSALLYLRVPDVRALTEELRSEGVIIDTEPHAIFDDTEGTFGSPREVEWMSFIKDSEDNLVGLATRYANPATSAPDS